MKNFKVYGFIAFFAAILLGFTACEETTDPDDPTNPNPPTNLVATSIDDNTIRIAWTQSTSGIANLNYHYYVYNGSNLIKEEVIDGDLNSYQITGLDKGIEYTIRLFSEFETGEQSTTAASVNWSTAKRFDNEAMPIRIYSWDNSTYGSGINLYNASAANPAPEVLKVGSGANWDLGFYDRDGDSTKFGSGVVALQRGGYNPTMNSITEVGDINYAVNSLDEFLLDTPLDELLLQGDPNPIQFYEGLINLSTPQFAGTSDVVFIVRTRDVGQTEWNYAKVLVVRDTDGDFVHGTGNNSYLQLHISYNTAAGLPYAK